MILQSEPARLARQVKTLVDQCRVSSGMRQAQAQAIATWLFVATDDDGPAIFNKIPLHIDRLASSLFSPIDPRFGIEYDQSYPMAELEKAEIAARWLTREFSRRDLDLLMGDAVDQALRYGSAILKLLWGHDGLAARLVMPWQFGVYVESVGEIDQQEALCETMYVTPEELWRRIAHRSDAPELYRRAVRHARRGAREDVMPAGLHNVLPPSSVGFGETSSLNPAGGGIVDVASAPMMPVMAPEIAASLIEAHELYVVNDDTGDYTTIQMVEPDIIIAPRLIRRNIFMPFSHPYVHVQINPQQGYFWGRSEVSDLLPLQKLLSSRLLDIKRILSLQYRPPMIFTGFSGMNDERYDQLIQEGWMAEEQQGADVKNVGPKLPEHGFVEIDMIAKFFDEAAGFDNALSGRGEPGIRSGNHFAGAVRMSSPRLRDRALRPERQYCTYGEKALWLAAAKDARAFWTDPEDLRGVTDFALRDLPADARVVVDSHSSSPIYEQDHANLAAFGLRAGALDAADILNLLPFPNRDALGDRLKVREKAKAQMLASLPPLARAELQLGMVPGERKKK